MGTGLTKTADLYHSELCGANRHFCDRRLASSAGPVIIQQMSVITLTTDFGHADWFVGATKGVILNIAPQATIVDLCHGIAGGDIRSAAFALAAAYKYFPAKTIHMAVVDPGVGSGRAAIAVQTERYSFVGPDNGVLSTALELETVKSIRRIDNPDYLLKPVSHTFHGRDVFAPVAAHLCQDPICFAQLGPELPDYHRISVSEKRAQGELYRGSVIYIDRFGNAITDIGNDTVGSEYQIVWCSRAAFPLKPFYQAMPAGHGVAVRGSSGFVEIAINGGSAAERYKLKIGTPVTLRRFTKEKPAMEAGSGPVSV